jgi:hypothetical protein
LLREQVPWVRHFAPTIRHSAAVAASRARFVPRNCTHKHIDADLSSIAAPEKLPVENDTGWPSSCYSIGNVLNG